LKKALDKVCADCEAAYQALHASIKALCISTACLEHVKKQAELLEQHEALILLKKAQAVENLKELKCLKTKAEGSENSHSKRLYYKSFNADFFSFNT